MSAVYLTWLAVLCIVNAVVYYCYLTFSPSQVSEKVHLESKLLQVTRFVQLLVLLLYCYFLCFSKIAWLKNIIMTKKCYHTMKYAV